jgi:hypothetical protein
MVIFMWTQLNILTEAERATLLQSSVRSCVQVGLSFLLCKMKYYKKNLRYKGAKSIWNWSLSDWIAYIIILIIFGIIYYFSKL